MSLGAFGPSPFAYITGRGARDAILFFVSTWLAAFASGRRVALYCSGVSGLLRDPASAHMLHALKVPIPSC
eukprot:6126101-Alexandrium_andersonii.AAC.1